LRSGALSRLGDRELTAAAFSAILPREKLLPVQLPPDAAIV
jgi:hypothetical protein